MPLATHAGGRLLAPLYPQFRCAVEKPLIGVGTCAFDPVPQALHAVQAIEPPR